MKGLEEIFKKLIEEKAKEKESILKEAQAKRATVVKELEEQAQRHYQSLFVKEKDRVLRKKQEETFRLKLGSKKSLLQEEESILNAAREKIEEFLNKNKNLLPKKEVITKGGPTVLDIDIGEFLDYLQNLFSSQIQEFFAF